jgi:hypothetical protein
MFELQPFFKYFCLLEEFLHSFELILVLILNQVNLCFNEKGFKPV